MKKSENLLHNSGFSLMEIMIAIGLMGVLSYTMMSLNELGRKTTKEVKMEVQVAHWKGLGQTVLGRDDNCTSTLRGVSLIPGTDYYFPAGEGLSYSSGRLSTFIQNAALNGVLITDMRMANIIDITPEPAEPVDPPDPVDPADPLDPVSVAPIRVEMRFMATFRKGPRDINWSGPVVLAFLDPNTDEVLSCYSADGAIGAAETFCNTQGGVFTPPTNCEFNGSKIIDISDSLLEAQDKIADLRDDVCLLQVAAGVAPANGNSLSECSETLGCGSTKSDIDCTNAGGSLISHPSGRKICRFNGSSCPSGFSQCESYSATEETTCTSGLCDLTNGGGSVSSGSHTFANLTLESVPYSASGSCQTNDPSTCAECGGGFDKTANCTISSCISPNSLSGCTAVVTSVGCK